MLYKNGCIYKKHEAKWNHFYNIWHTAKRKQVHVRNPTKFITRHRSTTLSFETRNQFAVPLRPRSFLATTTLKPQDNQGAPPGNRKLALSSPFHFGYVLFALHRSHWCDNILWCCSIQTLNTCSTRWVSCHCSSDTCFIAVFQPIHNIDMILKPSLFFISNFTQVPMPLLFLQQGALMFQLETSCLKTLCSTTAAEYHDKGGLF